MFVTVYLAISPYVLLSAKLLKSDIYLSESLTMIDWQQGQRYPQDQVHMKHLKPQAR